MPRMELLALIAISLMSLMGWVVVTEYLGQWIDHDNRFYFAPAIGMAACAIIAYLASDTRQTWLIPFFALIVLVAFVQRILKTRLRVMVDRQAQHVFNLTLLTLVSLFGKQISLFHLFKGIYPKPDEVWDLFNLCGIAPPDQMFQLTHYVFIPYIHPVSVGVSPQEGVSIICDSGNCGDSLSRESFVFSSRISVFFRCMALSLGNCPMKAWFTW